MHSQPKHEQKAHISNGARILVLYAKSGALGHKVIADNYTELLKLKGYNVVSGDAFELDDKFEVRGQNKFYFWMLAHAPWLWRFLYDYWLYLPGAKWFKDYVHPRHYPKTAEFVIAQKPDLIITTHPVATGVVNLLKREKLYQGPLLTTFSDWHTQPFHIYKYVDTYLVVTEEEKVQVLRNGGRAHNVVVPGMLLAQKYYHSPTKSEARKKLNLPQDKKIILVMGGGLGWEIEKTLENLPPFKLPTVVVVISGTEERKKEIEEKVVHYESLINKIAAMPLPSKILDKVEETFPNLPINIRAKAAKKIEWRVESFVEPSLYFAAADLIISKPGGLTTSQAFLVKLPFLVTKPLPGHEDKNTHFLLQKKAVILADEDNFANQVQKLISDEKLLADLAESAHRLAPVHAPEIVLDTIEKTLYSGVGKPVDDTNIRMATNDTN